MRAGQVASTTARESIESRLLRRMTAAVRAKNLFASGNKLLVAVSGGPDSVALVSLLHRLVPSWRLTLSVAHVNYGLRGQESEEDAQWVRGFCDRLNLPCTVVRAERLADGAGRTQGSLQQRARQIRYHILRTLAFQQQADKVALGHTADDQAETILLWLLRGTGLTGLSGMPHVREDLFVRPFLTISKSDLLAYLSSQAIGYRTDSSNATSRYRRNKIRHEIMPSLTALAPSFVETMRRQSEVLAEEDRFLENLVSRMMPRVRCESGALVLDRTALLRTPLALQRRIVRRLLRQFHDGRAASFAKVDAVLQHVLARASGAHVRVGSCEVLRDGETIRFTRISAPVSSSAADNEGHEVGIPGTVWWPATRQHLTLEFISEARARMLMRVPSKQTVVFDAGAFTPRLTVRGWRPGDRFAPVGMNGRQKKLQDFFIDAKVSRLERSRIPLLTAPEGILWVSGYRADERFIATSSTQRFALATLSEQVAPETRD